jgi:hypothetical protein
MNTDEIKEFVKTYIKENLKIKVEEHYSSGYYDTSRLEVEILIENEVLFQKTIFLPDD